MGHILVRLYIFKLGIGGEGGLVALWGGRQPLDFALPFTLSFGFVPIMCFWERYI